MNLEYPERATPIDLDEAQGLLLPHIRTRAELDRWEQKNITEAEEAVFRRRQKNVLTDAGESRRLYIDALRAADRHDYGPLLAFVRS
jgi:hypothetical protein